MGMRTLGLTLPTVLAALLAVVVAGAPAAPATPPAPAPQGGGAPTAECGTRSTGERPSATADDVVNCVVERLGPARARLTVMYTYASPLGKQNIFLGTDLLAGGNRLKWFGYRPAPITASSGTASLEVIFGVNNPPAGKLVTDQVEFFLYVGGGQIFYRKMFAFKHEWSL
jgi:hypothetical protein